MMMITLYTRPDCETCRQAETWLSQLNVAWRTVDITTDAALSEHYDRKIPVVSCDGRELAAPFTFDELAQFVRAPARLATPGFPVKSGAPVRTADRITMWLARHWLTVINVALMIYLAVPVLAPVLMAHGFEAPARLIYKAFLFMCHELPQRSYFLYGPRLVYSLDQLMELAQVDQLPGYPLYGAYREFVGNPTVGYKVALCQRDFAIYAAMLLTGLIFGLVRRRARPLSFWLYLVIGIGPVALDGGSQLIGYMFPQVMPGGAPRESTWLLRTITGALFGWATMWLVLPNLQASFAAMDEQLADRYSTPG